jgi:hypothetical protein
MITLVLYTVGNSEEKCIEDFNVTTSLAGILFCPLCSQGVMPQLPSITQHPQKKKINKKNANMVLQSTILAVERSPK